ncbi:hypothetical protein Leryth_013113 [Lithospermum erythrorhizon]|nr:hypothetical protein Leryth_013113 [Lithospermum erythrorhizon]
MNKGNDLSQKQTMIMEYSKSMNKDTTSLKKNNVELEFSRKASDAISLPIRFANAIFFPLFFSVVYYLLMRWREKIRNSTPLHVVSLHEILAIVALVASSIYLHGFFSIGLIQLSEEEEEAHIYDTKEVNKDIQVEEKCDVACTTAASASPKEMIKCCPEEDEEIVQSVVQGKTPSYSLESKLGDCFRAAAIRREALQRVTGKSLEGLPLEHFDYDSILGQCCEMPIGYVQLPVGIAGPLLLDDKEYSVPMATTEGCLVASTNRGCKAIYASGGATSVVLRDAMTRAPVVRFGTAKRAAEVKFFLEDPLNFETLSAVFNQSSRFGRLQSIKCAIAGKNLYMRFSCSTGDAMGMNMVSKGTQHVIEFLEKEFPDMDVIGISGNYCSDKKPAAVNWIEGRGKSVVCEAIIPEEVVKNVLKTDVASLVGLTCSKRTLLLLWLELR